MEIVYLNTEGDVIMTHTDLFRKPKMTFRLLYLGFPVYEADSHELCMQVATYCGYNQFFILAYRNGQHVSSMGYIAEHISR